MMVWRIEKGNFPRFLECEPSMISKAISLKLFDAEKDRFQNTGC